MEAKKQKKHPVCNFLSAECPSTNEIPHHSWSWLEYSILTCSPFVFPPQRWIAFQKNTHRPEYDVKDLNPISHCCHCRSSNLQNCTQNLVALKATFVSAIVMWICSLCSKHEQHTWPAFWCWLPQSSHWVLEDSESQIKWNCNKWVRLAISMNRCKTQPKGR